MNLDVLPNFEVIDESDDWLVVNKPAPLIVHPANRQSEPTLLGGVEKLLVFERANGAKPAIVNRLDRETSGLVLVAKHVTAARELGLLFERREVSKAYLAIVNGKPETEKWIIDAPIARAGAFMPSAIWVRQMVHPEGRECRTSFRVVDSFEANGRSYTMVECTPETGRMHQIRVHLKHSGHPIVGDKLYFADGEEYLEWMRNGWSQSLEKKLEMRRHALHASRMEIRWKGEDVKWSAPLPDDLRDFQSGVVSSPNPDVVIWNRDS